MGFQELLDRFDGKDIGTVADDVGLGNVTAHVEGDDVKRQSLPGFQRDRLFFLIDPRNFSQDEGAAFFFHDVPGCEANFFRPVCFSEHSRAHAGVIVICRRLDDRYPVTFLNEFVQVGQCHHVSVTTAGQDQVFFHHRLRKQSNLPTYFFANLKGSLKNNFTF